MLLLQHRWPKILRSARLWCMLNSRDNWLEGSVAGPLFNCSATLLRGKSSQQSSLRTLLRKRLLANTHIRTHACTHMARRWQQFSDAWPNESKKWLWEKHFAPAVSSHLQNASEQHSCINIATYKAGPSRMCKAEQQCLNVLCFPFSDIESCQFFPSALSS